MELPEITPEVIRDFAQALVPNVAKPLLFLEEQLDRHEAVARVALDDQDQHRGDLTLGRQGDVLADPVYVLADVAAKRAILEIHQPFVTNAAVPTCYRCAHENVADRDREWPCRTLAAMLTPYSDRPGFDPSWVPTK